MASLNVGNLGEYLREQRRNAQLSLRQLADAAGVSNPYLSQIERGLRKPSAEVLQQVAKALRISAETLYVRAGILDAERDRDEVETRAVILADPTLNERQKQVLLQIYESFRKENGFGIATADAANGANAADRADDADGAGMAAGTAVSDTGGDGGTAARRAREGDGDGDGDGTGERRPRTTARTAGGRTSAPRRTARTSDGSDADPQQTAG
ncbi:helix-turn-helix transcriptional regulator [Streptomyces sp. NPDC020996]|uniref:helix-turn-helix domain-containing protein n=1 Tax=Streptomyces sp. NPDC020996 TaxID=3154791 RepID=UPI003408586C